MGQSTLNGGCGCSSSSTAAAAAPGQGGRGVGFNGGRGSGGGGGASVDGGDGGGVATQLHHAAVVRLEERISQGLHECITSEAGEMLVRIIEGQAFREGACCEAAVLSGLSSLAYEQERSWGDTPPSGARPPPAPRSWLSMNAPTAVCLDACRLSGAL